MNVSDLLFALAQEMRECGDRHWHTDVIDCARAVRVMEEFCNGHVAAARAAAEGKVVHLRPSLIVLEGGRQ